MKLEINITKMKKKTTQKIQKIDYIYVFIVIYMYILLAIKKIKLSDW